VTGVDPDTEDVDDSESGKYTSVEDLELAAFSYELEYKKLYSKFEILLKANYLLSSQVGILDNARKVYNNLVADRDILLKASFDREEKLKQELEELKKRTKMLDNTSTLD